MSVLSTQITGYKGPDDINQAEEVAQPTIQAPKLSVADQIMQRLYAQREPAPVVDTEKAARLQRMGRINAISQAVGVLGDMFTLGQGGTVTRRKPDATSPAIYQSYQAMLDKEKNDRQAWSYRNYQNDRNNTIMQIGQEQQRERAAERAATNKSNRDYDFKKFAVTAGQKDAQINNAVAKNKIDAEYKDKSLAIKRSGNGIAQQRVDIERNKTVQGIEKPLHPIGVTGDDGRSTQIDEGQWTRLYQDAGTDKEFAKNYIPAILKEFQLFPAEGQKEIARKYYYYLQEKRKTASNGSYDSGVMLNPAYNATLPRAGAASVSQAAPAAQPQAKIIPGQNSPLTKEDYNNLKSGDTFYLNGQLKRKK